MSDKEIMQDLLKTVGEEVKKTVLYRTQEAFRKEYEKRLYQYLGLNTRGYGAPEIIKDGFVDKLLTQEIENSDFLDEVMESIEDIFKHTQPVTKNEIKQIKNEIRSTMRRNAIDRLKNETVKELQDSVNEYLRDALKSSEEFGELFEFDKLLKL